MRVQHTCGHSEDGLHTLCEASLPQAFSNPALGRYQLLCDGLEEHAKAGQGMLSTGNQKTDDAFEVAAMSSVQDSEYGVSV